MFQLVKYWLYLVFVYIGQNKFSLDSPIVVPIWCEFGVALLQNKSVWLTNTS